MHMSSHVPLLRCLKGQLATNEVNLRGSKCRRLRDVDKAFTVESCVRGAPERNSCALGVLICPPSEIYARKVLQCASNTVQ